MWGVDGMADLGVNTILALTSVSAANGGCNSSAGMQGAAVLGEMAKKRKNDKSSKNTSLVVTL